MSLFGGSKSFKPDTYASEKYAAINREDWADYQQRYVPRENEIMQDIANEGEMKAESVERSDELTDASFESARGSIQRNRARYGGMTADQQTSVDKTMALEHSAAKVGNRNNARQMVDDRMLGLQSSMVNLGRGQKSRYTAGFGQAASMEAGRNSTNRGIEAQQDASKKQFMGTMVGIGAMAAMAM